MEPPEHLVTTACPVPLECLVWMASPEFLDVEEQEENRELPATMASPAYLENSLTEQLVPTVRPGKTENPEFPDEEDFEAREGPLVLPELMATLALQVRLEMMEKTEHQV